MTDREKHLLWIILNKSIHRYIIVNMPNCGSGERADLHFYISKILCHYITINGGIYTIRGCEDEYPKGTFAVHDWIAENLTDQMDKTIGFIIERQMTHKEQEICAKKFFDFLCKHILEIEEIVKNSDREEIGCINK